MRVGFRWGIVLLSVIITACSNITSGPAATSVPIRVTIASTNPPTLTPLALTTTDANCPTDQLRRWLLYSTSTTSLFIQYVDASENITPEQSGPVMAQLAQYRTPLGTIPIPTCAVEESQMVFTMMNGAFNAIKNFGAHKQDTLSPDVALANLRYEQIKEREQQLLVLLQAMQNVTPKH